MKGKPQVPGTYHASAFLFMIFVDHKKVVQFVFEKRMGGVEEDCCKLIKIWPMSAVPS
jgi:hypothetical protein